MLRLPINLVIALLIGISYGNFAPEVAIHLPLVIGSRPAKLPPDEEPNEPCLCSSNLYDCSNFDTQSQAQACFAYCVQQGRGDVHVLDRDNDNVACENWPPSRGLHLRVVR
jgi:hypothetical protein